MPLRLFYDLETCQEIVSGYGTKWDFKVMKILRYSELMCFSYAWDDDEPIFVNRWKYDTYRDFLYELRNVIDKCEILIAYNGIGFDNKAINTLFMQHRIPLPSPYKVVDPLRTIRSMLNLPSNSLNDVCDFLGIPGKEKIGNADLEDDWMTGNPSRRSVRLMKLYNKTDVERLRQIYYIFLPLIKNHPNMGDLSGKRMVCPKCEDTSLTIHKVRKRANGNTVIQYQCSNGHYSTDPTVKKTGLLRSA